METIQKPRSAGAVTAAKLEGIKKEHVLLRVLFQGTPYWITCTAFNEMKAKHPLEDFLLLEIKDRAAVQVEGVAAAVTPAPHFDELRAEVLSKNNR